MHADLYREVERQPAASITAQQELISKWKHEFNHARPHEALGLRTPSEIYQPSSRSFPPPALEYGETKIPTKVSRMGMLRYGPWQIYAAQNLGGHELGLEPLDGHVLVWFGSMLLGHFVPGEDKHRARRTARRGPLRPGEKVRVSPPPRLPAPVSDPVAPAPLSTLAEGEEFNFWG